MCDLLDRKGDCFALVAFEFDQCLGLTTFSTLKGQSRGDVQGKVRCMTVMHNERGRCRREMCYRLPERKLTTWRWPTFSITGRIICGGRQQDTPGSYSTKLVS